MRTDKLFIVMLALLLTGCTTVPQNMTLDQMLAGRDKAEQRAILKKLCLLQVQKRPYDLLTKRFYASEPDVPLLEQVCKKMAAEMAPCDVVLH